MLQIPGSDVPTPAGPGTCGVSPDVAPLFWKREKIHVRGKHPWNTRSKGSEAAAETFLISYGRDIFAARRRVPSVSGASLTSSSQAITGEQAGLRSQAEHETSVRLKAAPGSKPPFCGGGEARPPCKMHSVC